MSDSLELIIALQKAKPYNPLVNGKPNTIYIDSTNGRGYIWDVINNVYVKVFDKSLANGIEFQSGYDAINNVPDIKTLAKQTGWFWIVTNINKNISPPLAGGISSVSLGDRLIWNGTEFTKIPQPQGSNVPIVINSNTTISQFDTTYLVDTTVGNITITIPLSDSTNVGLYTAFIKTSSDANKLSVIPTAPQKLNGDTVIEIYKKDESMTLRSTGGGVYGWIPEDYNRHLELEAISKLFGSQDGANGYDGRLRFDQSNGHWFFEVRQLDGSYLNKLEVGGSIIVDVVKLIQGEKPTNIPPNEIALFNREITLADGSKTIRPEMVLSNGDEYGLVVNNQQTDEIVYRKNTGELGRVPKFQDLNATQFVATNTSGDRKLSVTYTNGAVTNVDMNPLFVGTGTSSGFDFDGGNASTIYNDDLNFDGGGA